MSGREAAAFLFRNALLAVSAGFAAAAVFAVSAVFAVPAVFAVSAPNQSSDSFLLAAGPSYLSCRLFVNATMLALLKFLQSLVKTLHSEGTPTQIALGVALGSALGITPIANLHNLLVLLLLAVLNVSFGAGMLAWAVFVPVGFMLDPVFDRLGHWLLVDMTSLRPLWTTWDNTPILALTNFTNTVVLGSVVAWVVLFMPIYLASRVAVVRYRATLGERFQQSHFYKLVSASQLYNVYRWFRP